MSQGVQYFRSHFLKVNLVSNSTTKQYLENLTDERNSAALYRTLAEIEENPKIAEVYRRLAATEEAHAATWAEKLKAANVAVPPVKLGWRTRTLVWAAHRFGPSAVLPSMAAMEKRGDQGYTQQNAPAGMAQQERSPGMLLNTISQTAHGGMEGPALAKLEGRHRSAGGNALRAAVLGANDGLVSNFSLVMGVAGAEVANGTIVLTGVAGLLAGAISMALGEWVSVQSSRELYQKQIRTEKEEIAANPAEEAEELSLIYQARGLEENAARQLAEQIMSNEAGALEALSRDELGIDPEELGGSAWEAAITSFFLFAVGAIIPLVPFFFTSGATAIVISAILSAIGLFGIGTAITLFTGRSVLFSGTRQMLFGLAAAAITFLIGRLIGVSVAG
jgi:VIT1/CCC1 family predicted Fe2+/Mn2+ transporter